jgi:hypothetical protein
MKTQPVEVDNAIEEALRLAVVAAGYLADKLLYLPANVAGYDAANDTIRTNKGFIIEVEGSSAYDSRNTKKDAVIYLNRLQIDPSSTGIGQDIEFVWNVTDQNYDSALSPSSMYDMMYQVGYSTGSEETASICESIIISALGARKCLTAIKTADQAPVAKFTIHRLAGSGFDVSDDEGLERGARFMAKYIDLEGSAPLGKIAPFDITKFVFEQVQCDRETLFKKIVETFAIDGITVNGYNDIYKLGLEVYTSIAGDTLVSGPDGHLYKIEANGTITYLSPNL